VELGCLVRSHHEAPFENGAHGVLCGLPDFWLGMRDVSEEGVVHLHRGARNLAASLSPRRAALGPERYRKASDERPHDGGGVLGRRLPLVLGRELVQEKLRESAKLVLKNRLRYLMIKCRL
jgi:hypothetical protein